MTFKRKRPWHDIFEATDRQKIEESFAKVGDVYIIFFDFNLHTCVEDQKLHIYIAANNSTTMRC